MAKEVLFLVEEAAEGRYVARALGYSILTEAESWEELKQAIRNAVQCHFEDEELPDLIRLHAVRDEVAAARAHHETSAAPGSRHLAPPDPPGTRCHRLLCLQLLPQAVWTSILF